MLIYIVIIEKGQPLRRTTGIIYQLDQM